MILAQKINKSHKFLVRFILVAIFMLPSSVPAAGQDYKVRKVPDHQRPKDVVTSFRRKAPNSKDHPWKAIGRVNVAGTGHCSGSLVAENIVLTAAHCLYSKRQGKMVVPGVVHFLAGYAHGKYAGHSTIIAYQTGAGFDGAKGANTDNMPHDWALLILTDPLGATLGFVPLHDSFLVMKETPVNGERKRIALSTSQIAVAGYPRDRSHILSLEENCKIQNAFNRGAVLVTSCTSLQGDSGGPILQPVNDKWVIVGVQTASAQRGHVRHSIGVSGLAFFKAFSALLDAQSFNGKAG